ncbi:hypothetical protein Cch01nite_09060 [Cellulomonas chitinilytica]|uniref:DUF2142 domain-containing protein n=1 Tax=Cellulomonas chitinilytica TaxID=398759 RepID=A0A919U156_9CELL|nr:hypothetical protein Cch01nite_09060 [Cellulomonas chitinilytica]
MIGIVGLAAFVLSLLAWALASPVGATPDEDYHLASIWCGHGARSGLCEPGETSTTREVQQRLLSSPCFAFQPPESAACQGPIMNDDTELVETRRGNFDGSYPPLFYFTMSFLVGDHVADSVILMRVMNILVVVLMLAATWLAAPSGLRRGLVAGVAVTVVPLGMFLLPSINPSSWALLSAMTLPIAVLGYITTEDRRRRLLLGALAAVALVIGAGARADAAMYGALAIGLAGIMTLRTGWAHVRRLVYPAVLGVAALFAFFTTGQSESIQGGASVTMSFPAFLRLMGDIPALWTGALGSWGLGWLDTYMPAVVSIAAWGALVGVVFAALAGADLRQLAALVVGGVAVWVVPTYMQYLSGYPVGASVQPRYILPIIVIIAVVAVSRVRGPAVRWSGGQWLLVVAALSVANAEALHFNIRRYVTGAEVVDPNLGNAVEWWWPSLPVGPMLVWLTGAVTFAVAVALLTLPMVRASDAVERRDPADEAEPGLDGTPDSEPTASHDALVMPGEPVAGTAR